MDMAVFEFSYNLIKLRRKKGKILSLQKIPQNNILYTHTITHMHAVMYMNIYPIKIRKWNKSLIIIII